MKLNLDLKLEVGHNVPEALFRRRVVIHGHDYVRTVRWETRAPDIAEPSGWKRVLVQRDQRASYGFFVASGCLVYISLSGGLLRADVVGEPDAVDEICEVLRGAYPEVKPKGEQITYTFWYRASYGGANRKRTLAVTGWDEIAANYAPETGAALAELMATETPQAGGGLLLWHGEPGTGKTHALRALSWAWREWCDFNYIIDPERFFADTEYMLDVLLDEDGDEGRWRMLILEDTGELVVADARQEAGQGLARLLNIADGLIGQGLRVQFLVTTNEVLGALHPAVLRPGRCSGQIEFKALPYPQAAAWAAQHGFTLAERRAYPLAELFARRDGKEIAPERPRLGFLAS